MKGGELMGRRICSLLMLHWEGNIDKADSGAGQGRFYHQGEALLDLPRPASREYLVMLHTIPSICKFADR